MDSRISTSSTHGVLSHLRWAFVYFFALVIMGGLFLMNLALAVLSETYNAENLKEVQQVSVTAHCRVEQGCTPCCYGGIPPAG